MTFRYIYEEEYLKTRRSLIFTVVFIVIGMILLSFESELSTLFFAIAVYGLFMIHNSREPFQRLKDNHMREIRKLLSSSEINFSATLNLTDKALRVQYENLCSFNYWSDFEQLKIKKGHLLLIPLENKKNTIVISEAEVTSITFEELYSFLREKIKD